MSLRWRRGSGRGPRGINIADAGHYEFFGVGDGAALGVRNHVLHSGDGQALADAAALVDFLVFTGGEGNALDHLLNVLGQVQAVTVAARPSFLRRDGDAFLDGGGIMRANLGTDAVF